MWADYFQAAVIWFWMGYVYADVMGINSDRRDGGLGDLLTGRVMLDSEPSQVTVTETDGAQAMSTINWKSWGGRGQSFWVGQRK